MPIYLPSRFRAEVAALGVGLVGILSGCVTDQSTDPATRMFNTAQMNYVGGMGALGHAQSAARRGDNNTAAGLGFLGAVQTGLSQMQTQFASRPQVNVTVNNPGSQYNSDSLEERRRREMQSMQTAVDKANKGNLRPGSPELMREIEKLIALENKIKDINRKIEEEKLKAKRDYDERIRKIKESNPLNVPIEEPLIYTHLGFEDKDGNGNFERGEASGITNRIPVGTKFYVYRRMIHADPNRVGFYIDDVYQEKDGKWVSLSDRLKSEMHRIDPPPEGNATLKDNTGEIENNPFEVGKYKFTLERVYENGKKEQICEHAFEIIPAETTP
jgi:hypothetical protein